MSVRLSELAKALGTSKKELLEKLPSLGFELKKSVVDIEDGLAEEIRVAIKKSGVTFAAPPKKPTSRVVKKKVAKKAPAKKVAKKAAKKLAKKAKDTAAPAAIATPEPTPEPTPPTAPPPESTTPATASATPIAAKGPSEGASPTAEPAPVVKRPVAPPRPAAPPARMHDTVRVIQRAGKTIAPMPASVARPAPASPKSPSGRGGGGGGRQLPEQPRSTPKAARPAFPRPMGKRGRGRGGRRRKGGRPMAPTSAVVPTTHKGPLRPVDLGEGITVADLSEKIDVRTRDIIKALLTRGIFATINEALEEDIAIELCKQFGYEASIVSFEEEAALDQDIAETDEDQELRPPVVTVMGHVDHGKTSLLDSIREANVADKEAGKITQHIGAYQVVKRERLITFVDTPGHAAFTEMRSRGARVTDIVVLVVAADDGVMPQTVEAINHAKAAEVPIIVAVNKMDLPTANPDRVLQGLSEHELLAEEWGGETVVVKVSAKKHEGLDDLLEMILLTADIRELTANKDRAASGVVLEAKLDKGRGPVATVLIQQGTIRTSESFIAGAVYGKVRAMYDDRGGRIDEAGPSSPVEILGLQAVPTAGDPFQVVPDAKARQIGSIRQAKQREQELAQKKRVTLGDLYKQISSGDMKELSLVVKADVQGSVEALTDSLNNLSDDKVKVSIIHAAPGAVTETDIHLAAASNAIVVGFNVRPERKARDLAEHEGVEIRLHTVIYKMTDEITAAMKGLHDPTIVEVVLGRIEIRQLFRVPKVGVIAGCYVLDGRVTRDAQVRLLRDNVIVYTGKLASLKRFKEDASEVRGGYECGLSIANYQDMKEGDVLEAFRMETVEPDK